MIGAEQSRVQLFRVIIHDDQVLVDRRLNDRGRECVLGEMELEQAAGIVGPGIGSVAEDGVRFGLGKIVEAVLELLHTEGRRPVSGESQDIQEEPKTGAQGDGHERQNYEFMTTQADQFNITGKWT
jgi:hypothetical protein